MIGRVRTRSSLVDRWLDDGEGDQRTRVLLATVNKRGSTEQPVAIDVLCRVTDLRPEMQDEAEPFVPFAPGSGTRRHPRPHRRLSRLQRSEQRA